MGIYLDCFITIYYFFAFFLNIHHVILYISYLYIIWNINNHDCIAHQSRSGSKIKKMSNHFTSDGML